MSWLRIEYHFGPGHQGTEIKYVRIGKTISPEEENELVHEYASEWWDQWRGYANVVDKLPKQIWDRKYAEQQARILDAECMLEVLKKEGPSEVPTVLSKDEENAE